ncbi:MAG: hypothetical protein V2I45_05965 [Halieaceae bacterium]|jgi:hypothetical protein|nr:hypothetical protein [Halieaceae bacterium]
MARETIDEFMQLEIQLQEVKPDKLRAFILQLYASRPDLMPSIEALALSSDPKAVAKLLRKRVQSLRNGRKFIDYRAASAFAADMDALLADIAALISSAPDLAWQLLDQFLATAPKVMQRVDDSSGWVGDVYRQAVLHWLDAADAWQDADVDWVERIYALNQQNDYGLLDGLLSNADRVLGEQQLRQLAWRYEGELRTALKEQSTDSRRLDYLDAMVAMKGVAEALRDAALYERALLMASPEPNELQLQDLCRAFIRLGDPAGALKYLERPWPPRYEDTRLSLLDTVYAFTDDTDRQLQIREQRFKRSPSAAGYRDWLACLPESAHEEARLEAMALAEQQCSVIAGANLLLELGESAQAGALVVQRREALVEAGYSGLVDLAKALDKSGCALAATACYRALLLDILVSGRSRAYGHAARYVHKLAALATEVADFSPLASHEAFMADVSEQHKRKTSFWAKVSR